MEDLIVNTPTVMPAAVTNIITTADDHIIRQKRNTLVHKHKCRKVDHAISFKELNSNYVIAPTQENVLACVIMNIYMFYHSKGRKRNLTIIQG